MSDLKSAKRLLDRCKVKLMSTRNSVFISTILWNLDTHFDDTIYPPTACTNGLFIKLHPDYWQSLSDEQRLGLLVHECWHVCWNHMQRGMDLNHVKYNIAGDYVINLMLQDAGYSLPPGGFVDNKYRDMSTKQVYDMLPDPDPNDEGMGDVQFADPNTPKEELEQRANNITNTVIKAMTQSKMAGDDPGSIPGEIRRWVDELVNPILPWNRLLQQFMDNFIKEDYSWRRPQRRFAASGHYLPSQHSERVANITAAIDLSGSITGDMLKGFLSELEYIQGQMRPEMMNVLGWDTQISDNFEIVEGDRIIDLEFTGGGGTRITPVMNYLNDKKPTVTIIFTDFEVEGDFPEIETPLIWVIVDNPQLKPSFGEVVYYDSSKIR